MNSLKKKKKQRHQNTSKLFINEMKRHNIEGKNKNKIKKDHSLTVN